MKVAKKLDILRLDGVAIVTVDVLLNGKRRCCRGCAGNGLAPVVAAHSHFRAVGCQVFEPGLASAGIMHPR